MVFMRLLVRAVAAAVLAVAAFENHFCFAAVHKVGDAAGWTTIGNVDYKQWSALKNFKLGDVILFQYNAQFHNVMQVTHAEFKACNTTSPRATYTSGNDSVTITTRGHHFFLCGVPGHCQSGQKVDINIPRIRAASSPPAKAPATNSPESEASSSSSPTVPAMGVSGPSPNEGVSLIAVQGQLGLALGVAFSVIYNSIIIFG